MGKRIYKLISLLLVLILVMPTLVVSAEENTMPILEPVIKAVNSSQYEEGILSKIPKEMIELTNLDISTVVGLDSVDKDNMSSFTTINSDGTKTLYSFDKEIKYVDDETDTIKFIDATISEVRGENVSDDVVSFESEGSPVNTVFSKDAEDGFEINNEAHSIKLIPKIENIEQAEIKIDTEQENDSYGVSKEYIEYSGVYNNSASLQYYVTNHGVKENIILEEYNGNNIIQFEIYTDELAPLKNEGNQIEFINEKTKEIEYIIYPTFIEEAYGIDVEGKEITYDNYYQVEEIEDNKYLLSMILDKAFLESEETIYPVLIDPTIGTDDRASLQDTYANNSSSADHSDEFEFYVSNASDVKSIAYMKYDVSNYTYLNPELINSVTFRAFESASGTSTMVSLYDCNSIYDINNVSYNQLYSDTGAIQSSCTAVTSFSFTITDLFKQWLLAELNESGGKSWEYGFRLKTSALNGLTFISSENSTLYPYVAINYTEDTSINDGVYYIKNKLSGKYLEVPNSAVFSSIQCCQDEYMGSKNQQWKVVDIGDGTYTLRPMHDTSFALDVYSGTYNGSAVDIWESSETAPIEDTKWKIIKNGNGSYRLMSLASDKKYSLAIENASLNSGAGCIQTIYSASQNDQWVFEPAIDAAEYYVTNVKNDKNLSVSSTGNAIVSIANTSSDAQRWSIVRQDNGTYKIYNKTGDWLNGADYLGCEISGDAVKLNSGGANLWKVIINDDGTYSFQNIYNEKYLTGPSSGSGVTVKAYTGAERQKWNITMAVKNICVGGFWECGPKSSVANFNYSANFVTDEVVSACEKMEYNELIVFEKGNSDLIRDMIRQSSIFAIHTHGRREAIVCNANGEGEVPAESFLTIVETGGAQTMITELPDDSFATTRLVLLGACATASLDGGATTNLAMELHEKGVQTVVCFDISIDTGALLYFQKGFMISLGEGNNLEKIIDDAEEYMYSNCSVESECIKLMNALTIIGNDDLSATFSY